MDRSLVFTGERYLPWLLSDDPFVAYEHLHRYLLASSYVQDKRVLDIACGEGYGSAMLARTARVVIGVDNDAATLAHAQGRYGNTRVQFVRADAQQFHLRPRSVDVVVSFETLEHFPAHEAFLDAIRTALTDDGILFISTPNRAMYSDADHENNPFHQRELYRDEFAQLLRQHFRRVRIFGQSLMANSMIAETTGEYILRKKKPLRVQMTALDSTNEVAPFQGESDLRPRYYVAICSNRDLGAIPDYLMVDDRAMLLNAFVDHHRQWSRLTQEHVHAQATAESLERQVQAFTEEQARAHVYIEEQERHVATLTEEQERARAYVATLVADLQTAQQTIFEQEPSLAVMEERLAVVMKREGEEREKFLVAHQQLLARDREMMQFRAGEQQLRRTVAMQSDTMHTLQWQVSEQEARITAQKALLDERLALLDDRLTLLDERLALIRDLERTLAEQRREYDALSEHSAQQTAALAVKDAALAASTVPSQGYRGRLARARQFPQRLRT